MSTRSVIIRLEAEVAGYVAGMGRAGVATDGVARQVVQARRSIGDNEQAMDKAGKVAMAFGAASLAALGASAKAAMDWESAWAGVTKTVDGTPDQMNALENSLRGLAKTLPTTHEEIAAVAEAAGQLGVKREDVAGFTKTMIDLGVSTNLTADEAATNIAQISNVMGTMAREGSEGVSRFGATLVALGNDGASTEKEILSMAQRIAGAAATVGASEVDVLALSNTLASMGIRAELGGGVTTRVLLKMYSAVKEGGSALDTFAKTAGVSAEEFSKKFGSSPVEALDMVNKGLNRVKNEGGNVVSVMKDMGLKGTEETQVMLALAASGDLLSDSLKLGNKSWQENTALLNEATKRYETTESKVKIAWNNIKDAAIDAGAVLLPVIQGVAESVTGLAQAFGSLPDPVKSVITVLAGTLGAGALLGGGMLTLIPKLQGVRTAFQQVDEAGSRIPGTWNRMAKAAGGVMGAVAAFETIKTIHNSMQPGTQSVEEFTQALIGMNSQQDSLDNMFKSIKFGTNDRFVGQINNAGDALRRLVNQDFGDATASFGATVLGIDNGMAKIKDAVGKADQAIGAAASSGNTALAAKSFKAIADSAKAQGVEVSKTAERFPLYAAALRELASQAGEHVSDVEVLNWMMGQTPAVMEKAAAGMKGAGAAAGGAAAPSKEFTDAMAELGMRADGTRENIIKFTDALINAGLLNLSARDAARGFEEAIDAVSASVAKNGTSLDIHTEQGRNNQAALDAIAGAGFRVVQANAKVTDSEAVLGGKLEDTYNKLIAGAGQFGITGQAAEDLARDILKIPAGVSVQSWMSDAAKKMAEDTRRALGEVDGKTVHTYSIEHKITSIETQVKGGGYADDPSMTALVPGRAGGGDLDMAPGPKGVDSQLFFGAKGEHVLTAQEVDLMGGQDAVYQFRANVRAGNVQGLAGGGAVGSQMIASRILVATAPAPINDHAAPGAKHVEQHFHGVSDPRALAYYSARLQEGA